MKWTSRYLRKEKQQFNGIFKHHRDAQFQMTQWLMLLLTTDLRWPLTRRRHQTRASHLSPLILRQNTFGKHSSEVRHWKTGVHFRSGILKQFCHSSSSAMLKENFVCFILWTTPVFPKASSIVIKAFMIPISKHQDKETSKKTRLI